MSGVQVLRPNEIGQTGWKQLQTIQREAFRVSTNYSQDQIDTLIGWDTPDAFAASHYNPNIEVGGKYNPDQEYSQPRVALAYDGEEIVGFAYSANNVSGSSEKARLAKKLSVVKNYLWLREIAVLPDYQRDGVATDLGRALLKKAISLQPVTAYIWPDIDQGFLEPKLEELGFVETGKQPVKIFGEDGPSVTQVRMEAPSVRRVLKNL